MNLDAGDDRTRYAIAGGLDIAVRPVAAPESRVRALLAALLVLTVLVAVPAVLGRQTGTTPPFGAARNGLIVWAIDGDIVAGDPVTGTTRSVIAGPGIDRNPSYSQDGSHLVFLRQVPTDTRRFDLLVSNSDGSSPVMLSAVPISTPDAVEWAPDGRSLLVNDGDGRFLRYFVDGSPARLLFDGVRLEPDAFRPPDGAQVLYKRDEEPGALYVMDRDGSGARALVGPTTDPCLCTLAGQARWSPDGQTIAFPIRSDGTESRIYVMGADGSGLRQLGHETGSWIETDPAWSPDGDQIAFNRWQRDDAGDWQVRAIGIVPLTGGPVGSLGVAPASEGALIEWSPDGRSILSLPRTLIGAFASFPDGEGSAARPVIIDPVDGSSRQIDWSVGSVASWQRLAP
jgi:Tol biopolymer transport system component